MSLETANDRMIKTIMDDLNFKGGNIYQALVVDKEVFTNSLPESIFINHFLPAISGMVRNDNWVMEWISIAGTPSAEVKIVADNTKEILFYVPPILDISSVLLQGGNGSLSDIFTRYAMYNNNLAGQGNAFLDAQLAIKRNELPNSPTMETIGKWIDIFNRYGYGQSHAILVAEAKNNSLDDYLDC